VVPSLEKLNLSSNEIDDAGLAALAPGLRQLPNLKELGLYFNAVGDRGLECLLAERLPSECWPTQPSAGLPAGCVRGVLPSLEVLRLSGNDITGQGCDAVAYAVCIGALQALRLAYLVEGREGEEAQEAQEDLDEMLLRGDLFAQAAAAFPPLHP